ncbi:MAG: hypothetical protein MdMp014T_0568 [Treponematales bacterium]
MNTIPPRFVPRLCRPLLALTFAVFACFVSVAPVVAAEVSSRNLPGIGNYVGLFHNGGVAGAGKVRVDAKYFTDRDSEIYKTTAALEEGSKYPNTALGFAIASYFTSTVNIRPVEAANMLPANSKASEVKLAAATAMALAEVRFLDGQNRDCIGRYEGMLQFIKDAAAKAGRPLADSDINAALAAAIGAAVDGEFGKISFFIENIIGNQARSYDGVLTLNAGKYILSYGNSRHITKELSAQTVDALLVAMSQSGDFSKDAIAAVRAQAALIPAVVAEKANSRSVVLVKDALVKFYGNPSQANYNLVKNMYDDFCRTEQVSGHSTATTAARESFANVLKSLSQDLYRKIQP